MKEAPETAGLLRSWDHAWRASQAARTFGYSIHVDARDPKKTRWQIVNEQRTGPMWAVLATGVLSGLLLSPSLFAQQSSDPPQVELQKDVAPSMQRSSQEEIEELFLQVERRLQRVTELLFEASSDSSGAADRIGGADIDDLVRGAEAQSSNARSDIAKLLEATLRQGHAVNSEIDRMIEISGKPST